MAGILLVLQTFCPSGGVVRPRLRELMAEIEATAPPTLPLVLSSEGRLPFAPSPRWRRLYVDGPRGAAHALRRSLLFAAEQGEALLSLEDDIELARDAIPRMVLAFDHLPRAAAFGSFFDVKETPHITAPLDGWNLVPPGGFDGRGMWGAQAVALRASTAVMLADADWRRVPSGGEAGAGDCAIGQLCAARSLGWAVYLPSLVQHIVGPSVATPGVVRRLVSPSFTGA